MTGFLHTGATFAADLNLLIQLAMGLTLLYGMRLARQRRFRTHAICQATVMLLNLVMIALIMIPSFEQQVTPNLGRASSDAYYAWPAVHALVGSIAQLLGIYVVLVASGAQWFPARLRFHNYRAWMRATLAIWWLVIGLGIGTYVVWYIKGAVASPAPSPTPADAAAAPARATVTIAMQNFTFDPPEITIAAGTSVTWNNTGGRHTVESVDGSVKSDTLLPGQSFEYTFDKPGTYDIYCGNHGTKALTGMVSKVIVSPK